MNPTPESPTDADRDDSEYAVPPGADAYVCQYCGAPFATEEYLTLHRGLDHYGALDEAEREAFERAYDDEQAAIGRFRIVALGALVLLYFGLLFAYAVFA